MYNLQNFIFNNCQTFNFVIDWLSSTDSGITIFRVKKGRRITLKAWFFDQLSNGVDIAFEYSVLILKEGQPLFPPVISVPFTWHGYGDMGIAHVQLICDKVLVPDNCVAVFIISRTADPIPNVERQSITLEMS